MRYVSDVFIQIFRFMLLFVDKQFIDKSDQKHFEF